MSSTRVLLSMLMVVAALSGCWRIKCSEDMINSIGNSSMNSLGESRNHTNLCKDCGLAAMQNQNVNKIHKYLSEHQHNQNLNKLQKYLNERQHDLIKRNPGSLLAVARAIKMTIVECQYQMRHEPWDCPIYGFSMRPTEIFGKLMSRSFKETSFIHSLLSAAVAHSVTRSCTEGLITTCRRIDTRDGGRRENIEFGTSFAQEFMEAMHETPSSASVDRSLNNNIIPTGNALGAAGEASNEQQAQEHGHHQAQEPANEPMMPTRRERKIRNWINGHNDELGRLHVLNGMRRECKCHGLSGACNIQTCWLKLPPFREVASKLQDSLDTAVLVVHYPITNRQKSLTSATVKKSNKKRSSSSMLQPVNGPTRSSTFPSPYTNINSHNNYSYASNSLNTDSATIVIGSRQRGTKRHTSSDNCKDCYRSPVGANSKLSQENPVEDQPDWRDSVALVAANNTLLKRRPVARSIGISPAPIQLDKFDLIYYEISPDFCTPSYRFNIKGTKGRICSENVNASNCCERLCCGRGYKREVREEKYKCQCKFQFCCKLDCKTCTRRKIVHKCL